MLRVLTWNVFHGRDFPPEGSLLTRRSEWLRTAEIGDAYAQVNRPLRAEYAQAIAAMEWDVALLQEVPPRWLRDLGRTCRASARMALTSRNFLPWLRARLAEWNPDLIGSDEGGSNQVLVRPPWRIADTRRMTLALRPERRRMLWLRLRDAAGREVCVANMHLSAGLPEKASREVVAAAERAIEWAAGAPLVFGGDVNIRPHRHPAPFEHLARELGLAAPTPRAIDHLLVRGLDVVRPPRPLPPACREIAGPEGRLVRLSDHDPVTARFSFRERGRLPASEGRTRES